MTTEKRGEYWVEEPVCGRDYLHLANGEPCWVPLSCKDHGGFGLLVWKMEGETRSPKQEARVQKVLDILNGQGEAFQILKDLITPGTDLDEVWKRAEEFVNKAEKL